MEKVSIEQEYHQMHSMLNEKQWRQYLAVEAQRRESTSQVARDAGVSQNTVKRGLKELEAGEVYQPGTRIRKPGGGMKKLVETDVMLLRDLEQELYPKGDPMSLVQWTSKSLAHLVEALAAKGHQIKKSALAEILHECKIRGKDQQNSGLKRGINQVSSTGVKELWRQRGCSDTWNDQPFTF